MHLGLLLCLLSATAFAANSHNLGSTQREMQAWFYDGTEAGYIVSGCLPADPGSGLELAAFACDVYVRDTSTGELIYVTQSAAAVTIADATPTWIAVHRDRFTTIANWTRVQNTHYIYRQSATIPARPDGALIVTKVTVVSPNIDTVVNFGPRAPVPPVSLAQFGAAGDGSDYTTEIQRAFDSLVPGQMVTCQGIYAISTTIDIDQADGISLQGLGARIDETGIPYGCVFKPVGDITAFYVKVQGINVKNVSVVGDYTSGAAGTGDCWRVTGRYHQFEKVGGENCHRRGFWINDDPNNAHFSQCVNCLAANNAEDGMHIQGTLGGLNVNLYQIKGGQFTSNEGDGIEIATGHYMALEGVDASLNEGYGINMTNGGNNTTITAAHTEANEGGNDVEDTGDGLRIGVPGVKVLGGTFTEGVTDFSGISESHASDQHSIRITSSVISRSDVTDPAVLQLQAKSPGTAVNDQAGVSMTLNDGTERVAAMYLERTAGSTYTLRVRVPDTTTPTGVLVAEMLSNRLKMTTGGLMYRDPVTFGAADGTPSVAGANVFVSGGTTTLSDFDDGILGQCIYIRAAHSFTVNDADGIIQLSGSANYAMTPDDTLHLCMFEDQVWDEISRKVD